MHPKLLLDNRGLASWRSGYAADCKSVYRSSILLLASILFNGLEYCSLIGYHLRYQFHVLCLFCSSPICVSPQLAALALFVSPPLHI